MNGLLDKQLKPNLTLSRLIFDPSYLSMKILNILFSVTLGDITEYTKIILRLFERTVFKYVIL